MNKVTVVIPARYASVRFPGKPIALLAGKPMLQWVWEGVQSSTLATRVVIATDDERIATVARGFGAECCLTQAEHPSGTDRAAEVAEADDAEIVVNVQGDEPLIRGDLVDAIAAPLLEDPGLDMATACRRFQPGEDVGSPDLVKVVCDQQGNALYFSRHAIPYLRDHGDRGDHGDQGGSVERAGQAREPSPYRLHLGLYAYRRPLLLRLAQMPPTPLERAEKLEQLRVLEHGGRIRVQEVAYESIGVDRPADVQRAELLLASRTRP